MSLFVKGAVALALSLAPAPAYDSLRFAQYPLVHKVTCSEGSGTAFRVGRNHWMSVAHVTAMTGCEIDGQPTVVTEQDGANDFSRLDTPTGVPNSIKVNCDGFVPGRWFFAIGHAYGQPFQTVISLYATYAKAPDGKRVLLGEYTVIPGMSGGPILNAEGEVVGVVNAFIPGTAISLSRELRDTSVCAKA